MEQLSLDLVVSGLVGVFGVLLAWQRTRFAQVAAYYGRLITRTTLNERGYELAALFAGILLAVAGAAQAIRLVANGP